MTKIRETIKEAKKNMETPNEIPKNPFLGEPDPMWRPETRPLVSASQTPLLVQTINPDLIDSFVGFLLIGGGMSIGVAIAGSIR